MKRGIRKLLNFITIVGLIMILATSCLNVDDPSYPPASNPYADRDGNVYTSVIIGTQVWMAENLKTTKYRNGDVIPNITDDNEWSLLKTGAQCNYNNDAANGTKYGKLYNWYAVNDSRNIAPKGWHVPTDEEWATLESYLSDNHSISGSVAKALASKTDWATSNNEGAVGNDLTKNNSTGFNALGTFYLFDVKLVLNNTCWWTSNDNYSNGAWYRRISYDDSNLARFGGYKSHRFYVRCIKD